MSSAAWMVAAGAIVALFSGFVLAGALTQPSEELLPAAGPWSTDPTATAETTSLVWERVEVPAGMDRRALRHSTGTHFVASSPDRTLVSRDGLAWTEVPVEGEVIDAYGGTLVVADSDDRISTVRVADDVGTSEDPPLTMDGLVPPNGDFRAYGPAGALAVECGDGCSTSTTVWNTADGRTWEQVYESPGEEYWEEVAATADGFISLTQRFDGPKDHYPVLYSSDGRTWGRIADGTVRLRLVGSTPFGIVLDEPHPDYPTRGLSVATPGGLEPLAVPAEVEAWWTDGVPDGWGAGGLGLVGVSDGMVAFSSDGVTWHLGDLPDEVPRFIFGYNGAGRSILHVTEDVVLLATRVCLDSQGTEKDCTDLFYEGDKTVWFRGTPAATASVPADPTLTTTAEPDPASAAEPADADETSSTPDLLPGVNLVTEEVEPGVFRVSSDGIRDPAVGVFRIIAGQDDGLWLVGHDEDGFSRLGSEVHRSPAGSSFIEPSIGDIEIGPDGVVWWAHADDRDSVVESFDGQEWTVRRQGPAGGREDQFVIQVETLADGTVLASWKGGDGKDWELARLGPGGWEILGRVPHTSRATIAADDVNDIWLLLEEATGEQSLYRGAYPPGAEGDIGVVALPEERSLETMDPGPDGTLWAVLERADDERRVRRVLARFDGSSWVEYDRSDGLPVIEGSVHAGPDGSAWFVACTQEGQAPSSCALVRFDGHASEIFLRSQGFGRFDIAGIAVGPGEAAWLLRWGGEDDERGLYVITPEAVAATE